MILVCNYLEKGAHKLPAICQETTKCVSNLDDENVGGDFSNCFNLVPKTRGFKMASLNIVSLTNKIDELRLSLSKKNIDLFTFNETRLDSTIPDNMINIDGYDVIRKDRSRNGGGVCLYLRSSINYIIRNDLIPTELEAVCVEITKPQSRPFLVTTIYRPPNTTNDFFLHFENLIKLIDDENKELYILGDLNCDMLKPIPDAPTKKIKSLYELYQLSQVINEATRVTMTSATLIDHVVTNTPDKISNSGVIHSGISDHSLIFAIRKIHFEKKRNENIVEMRNMKKFNSEKFIEDLICQHWEYIYFFGNNPNHMWDLWKNLFNEVLNKHAPIQQKKVRSKNVPWVTSDIKKLINERNKLKRKAILNKNDADWSKYKQMRNKVNIEIRDSKKAFYSTKIAEQIGNPKETWRTINHLLGRQNKPTNVNELNVNGINLTNTQDIAEGFNQYFSNIGPELASKLDSSNYNFQEFMSKPKSEFSSFQLITKNKIYQMLSSLSSGKATGIDKISNKILKLSAPVISDSLTYIFNQAITFCTFPDEWKIARLIPLFKNGQKNLPGNYRPISILPAISKIMERILYDQLYDYLTKSQILSDSQFGFRKHHSTATALLDGTNSWYMNIDKKLFNLVVFIDLKKAFDTVDHSILLSKLELYGIKGDALTLLTSYLTNRTQLCQINRATSSEQLVKCGVPQGSILGPLLFLLYINDLPQCLQKTKPRLFADDTNLTAAGKSLNEVEYAMNFDLECLRKWLIANKLSLNVAKTEFMLIGSKPMIKNISTQPPNIVIENNKIKQVNECKSLGVTIDQHLSWKKNTDNICKKIVSGISALRRAKDFVQKESLISIYNGLIQPYFNYCSEVWDVLGETQSNRLQKLQNRAARIISNMSNTVDHEIALSALNWEPLKIQRQKSKAKLMSKLLNNIGPTSLTSLFTFKSESTDYELRGAKRSLCLPQPRTNSMKKSFAFNGAQVWNSLPNELKQITSSKAFQNKIASHIFKV